MRTGGVSSEAASRLGRLRAFLRPVDNSDAPELLAHHVRGARAGAWMLLVLVVLLSVFQIIGGHVHPVRSIAYTAIFASIYVVSLAVLYLPIAPRAAEHVSFSVAFATAGMAIFAVWPSVEGRNPFAHFAFVFPIAMTGFVPVRPVRALVLGACIAGLYALARERAAFPEMLPPGEATAISLAFGLSGALAAQAQRYLLSELYRARAVAERQSHELALARDRALEASRVKTQFLANMSHEIRTPMAAILGFSDVIREHFKDESVSEEIHEAFDTVQRNGEHLLRLINDILDLSRLEVSEVQVERRLCSPDELTSEVVRILGARAKSKGIELRVTREAGAPRVLPTDPMRFRQIVLNIVENAIKFTAEGSVEIRLSSAQLDSGPALALDVVDTGVGMNEEQLERVFDPFVQADSSFTRRFGGTGLGLAISRRLALRLGGRLTAKSVLGRGSTFSLILPAMAESERGGIAAAGAGERAGTTGTITAKVPRLEGRILLAEDGIDNQKLLSLLLRKAGADVEVAENGRVAIEKIWEAEERGQPFGLVFMDMQMPEVDGYQATERLRDSGYSRPIVALTAHAMAGDSHRCLQAGCDAYLSKPVSKTLLVENAYRYLAGDGGASAQGSGSEPKGS